MIKCTVFKQYEAPLGTVKIRQTQFLKYNYTVTKTVSLINLKDTIGALRFF